MTFFDKTLLWVHVCIFLCIYVYVYVSVCVCVCIHVCVGVYVTYRCHPFQNTFRNTIFGWTSETKPLSFPFTILSFCLGFFHMINFSPHCISSHEIFISNFPLIALPFLNCLIIYILRPFLFHFPFSRSCLKALWGPEGGEHKNANISFTKPVKSYWNPHIEFYVPQYH